MEKRDKKYPQYPSPKISATICEIAQIFVNSLLLAHVINECLCEKVNNCVHCK